MLKILFERARSEGLRFKLAKCQFGQLEVSFLGELISENGLRVDPKKTVIIREYPMPRTKAAIQRYLGMIIYVVAVPE